MMENNKQERHVLLDQIIEATKGMDPQKYMEFMELPGPERLKRIEEILEGRNKGER